MKKIEETLWREFRKGDRDAFQGLLELFYAPLFEYGWKYQKDKDKLRDALHNLMISLWERRTFLNDTDNLRLYLFKALRHQIFREKSEFSPHSSLTVDDDYDDVHFPTSGYVEGEIIEEEIGRETTYKINAVLNKLSKRQQEVLHLKFYENLTNDQMAEVLGISKQAVANLVYQSLRLFRDHWQRGFIPFFFLLFLLLN